MDTLRFKNKISANYCRKFCKYTPVSFLNFLCTSSEIFVFKLFDLKRRKILNNLNAKDEARLTPCKDDKFKV